jgi:group I intron endonuclease
MENIKYTIYKLTDPISDEIRYIGLTFNDLKQRLKSHCSENSKSHKSNWIQQLKSKGLKPLIESIEGDISSYDYCCEREIYWIDKFKSEGHPLTNMASGGNKNKKMSDETRKKMSDSHIKRNRVFKKNLSESTKFLISKSSKERFKDDKEREKLRISNKRYEDSKTDEQKLNDILIQNPKKVYQYDKDMNFISEYPSIKNAEKKTNISSSNIAKCCKHKVIVVGGFIWRFEGDLTPPKYKNRKEVLKYDINMNLLEEYENIRKASLETKISDSSIRLCCNNKRILAGGFIWKYKDY